MMKKFQVYFGRSINMPDGSILEIIDLSFKHFCQLYIDPRLDCYTLFDGLGVWKGTSEGTTVLEVVAFDKNEIYETRAKLVDIMTIYNKDFDQECCLLVETDCQTSFC